METITQRPKTTPKDFFLNLGAIVALYVSVISILNLLFEVINRTFPDPLQTYIDPYSSAIRWTIASLFIIFPLYILFSWLLEREAVKNPEKRELSVRKWLIFLTLFVAGIVIAVDLIVLINTFLGGEITTRFVLKVIAVLAVVGAIFGYYLSDIYGKFAGKSTRTYFAWGSAIFVIASIVIGFMVMGSPTTQRLMRLDETRVSHLSQIQYQVVTYWQQKKKVPATLDDLKDPLSGFILPTDPVTGSSYEYVVKGVRIFELCATFDRSNMEDLNKNGVSKPMYPYGGYVDENWQHEAGKGCFERTIEPEKNRPLTDVKRPL